MEQYCLSAEHKLTVQVLRVFKLLDLRKKLDFV